MSIKDEFATRNFSIYGQWLGILSMILCFALGIANFFNLFKPIIILFSIICLVSAFIILFLEVPLLLRICPTSAAFDAAIRRVSSNYLRAAAYLAMALVQWLSLLIHPTSLVAAAVVLTFTSACYFLAGIKGQAFTGSKTLGGQGVAQMII
ncbi:hypothetical protein F5Y16DRAFT_249789 [Xylariaceae sp. FL0255]|nr:hypothetical protein F5Y16DRAFT_249789 [Xylariaceae sp. FL0255]